MFTKTDRNYWISGFTVLVLLGFLLYKKFLETKPVNNWLNAKISRFCVSQICLDKKDNRWWWSENNIQEPAEENIVNKFVEDLSRLTLVDVVSNNPDRFAQLGIVTDSPKIMVHGQELSIGNLGEDLETTYVKPSDENKVYLIKSVWGTKDSIKPTYWKIRYINNVSVFQIEEIILKYAKKIITLKPDKGNWKEKELVNKLAYLETVGYVGGALENWQSQLLVEIKSSNEDTSYEVGTGKMNNHIIYLAKVKNEFWQLDKILFDLLTSVTKTN